MMEVKRWMEEEEEMKQRQDRKRERGKGRETQALTGNEQNEMQNWEEREIRGKDREEEITVQDGGKRKVKEERKSREGRGKGGETKEDNVME